VDIIIYGLINTATLLLISIGFSLVYGVSRVANFAHGSIYILVGFIVWGFLNMVRLSYPLAIFFSLIITTLLGMSIYRFFLIRVRGIPISEIIGSFAIGMGIIELLKMVGFVGAYGNPVLVRGSLDLFSTTIDYQRLIAVGVALAIVCFLFFFTHYTKVGLALRAIAQDEQAAMMIGIDSDLVAAVSLALGSALTALAAIILLPLGNIYPGIGYQALIYAIAVCILGGLGSLTGTLLASLLLAFAQLFTTRFLGGEWHMFVMFLSILLILILKPSGLLGKQKELEERV
jgi:branched-chain amino acid transport system permease protein